MKSMLKAFRAIIETYRKRHQRGKGIKLKQLDAFYLYFLDPKPQRPIKHFVKASRRLN